MARPHGYSRAQMAAEVAPFTMSGNDPAQYPDTPFKILHTAGVNYEPVGPGVLAPAANTFSVPAKTSFFVPILDVDDVPPGPRGLPDHRR